MIPEMAGTVPPPRAAFDKGAHGVFLGTDPHRGADWP
jgi:hypothetical protein